MNSEHIANTVAVIPCLNEENFIGDVVRKASKYAAKVIVVDDGSSDGTAGAAGEAGAIVINHAHSMGAGAATRTGFNAALRAGAEFIVTLDGDGQHNPDEIPLLLQPLIEGKADIALGSRFIKGNCVPRYRKMGINTITWLYNAGFKEKILDSQCGFRAYTRKSLESINITYPGFGFSIQTLVQARKRGFRIIEVPVSCVYHNAGSTLNPVAHGINVALAVIKIRIEEELLGLRKG